MTNGTAPGNADRDLDARIAEARERVRLAQAALDDAWRAIAIAVGPPADDAVPAAGVARAGYDSGAAGPELEATVERLNRDLEHALGVLNDAERERGTRIDRDLRNRAGTIT